MVAQNSRYAHRTKFIDIHLGIGSCKPLAHILLLQAPSFRCFGQIYLDDFPRFVDVFLHPIGFRNDNKRLLFGA